MRTVSLWLNAALAVLALTCAAASAQAATGLEPGVHADPGSPAAKEYALPLDQARQVGSGAQQSGPSSSSQGSEGTLFGAGIKPPGSGGPSQTAGPSRAHPPKGGSGGGGGGAGSSGGAGRSAQSSGTAGAQPGIAQTVLRAERDQGSGDGGSSTLALLGGAVAVIVLGGFGGTVLRHSRRPT